MELKKFIELSNPEVVVTGGEYPPGPTKTMIATIITVLQYLFWALIMIGESLFNMLGLPTEPIKKLQENKWMYMLGSMFLCNTIKNGLTQTGAFEVYVNNNLVFSKLETGRIF
jgi:thioredoxin reductase-like selenoprotein T